MQRFLFSITMLALVFLSSTSLAQDNRVLELDGNDSYVELPAKLLDGIKEITVEGWVKWERFRSFSRFFDFGLEGHDLLVDQSRETPELVFALFRDKSVPPHRIQVPNLLRTNQWCHIATVAGGHGIQLYFNGAFMGSIPSAELSVLDVRREGFRAMLF